MEPDYMTTKEVQEFLRLSKSSYYRSVYHELLAHPTTRYHKGRPLFKRSTVEGLLEPIAEHMDEFHTRQDRARNHFGRGLKKKPGRRRKPGPDASSQLSLLP